MRLIFMGTPAFAAPVLSELVGAGHDIACVYTKAPRRSGRGQHMQLSPVHGLAQELSLPVRTPASFKRSETVEEFADIDADVAIVVAFGLILPQKILDAPRHGCLNLHASLLPRWRGAAPIHRAIMAGDEVTGVQVMRMEAGLDTGPILLSETTPILPEDTAGSLHDRLSHIAAQLAPRALAALSRDALTETPQSTEGVTYAAKISPPEARIDWSRSAEEVDCHIRGLSPFPGAWFETGGQRVKVLMCEIVREQSQAFRAQSSQSPGEVIAGDGPLHVACGAGMIALTTLQRSGKRAQGADVFLRGFPLQPGDRLD